MWNFLKKKVSNFFFEEIEEEIVMSENEEPKKNRDQRIVKPKVTYQYPKKEQHTPFRFPVIPDELSQSPSKRKVGKLNKYNQVQQRKWKPDHANKDVLIYGYKGKKVHNELEEIPAYLRRNKEKN